MARPTTPMNSTLTRNFGFKPPKVVPKNKGGKKKHIVSGRGRMEGHEFDGINGKMYRQTESRITNPFQLFIAGNRVWFLKLFPKHRTSNGCFRKWWYPQIIHFNRVFHYKPSIWGTPIFGNTQIQAYFSTFLHWFLQAQLFRIPGDGNPCLGSSVAVCTSPAKWTNVPWKGTIWNGNFIFQPSILAGYLSLGE